MRHRDWETPVFQSRYAAVNNARPENSGAEFSCCNGFMYLDLGEETKFEKMSLDALFAFVLVLSNNTPLGNDGSIVVSHNRDGLDFTELCSQHSPTGKTGGCRI